MLICDPSPMSIGLDEFQALHVREVILEKANQLHEERKQLPAWKDSRHPSEEELTKDQLLDDRIKTLRCVASKIGYELEKLERKLERAK